MPETASENQKQKIKEREGEQKTEKLAKLMIAGRLNT
jgi:hypothetical protein